MTEPSIHIAPEYGETRGEQAYQFGESFGITLDPWQRLVMDDWLAIDDNHKWACSTCGLSVPRQNGKTALVKVRVMYGIFVLGEVILFTCHEVRTSRQVFDSLADILNPNGEFPELASQVQYIKRSNGYEEIKVADWYDGESWHKGGKLLFSSRSKGASRGFTADVVVADEAMYMTDEQVAALVPTMASSGGGDMQFIMLGTPPSPGDGGTVFKNTRNAALNGEKGISWCEWGADEVGDIHDWDRIAKYNPSLGTRLLRKAVESELSVMSPDTFARERLGWWSKASTQQREYVIDESDWHACKVDNPSKDGIVVYAVKFSPDGAVGTLAACHKPDDGIPFVYVVESRSMSLGLSWFVDKLSERKDKAANIVIDGQSNAQALNDMLLDRGVAHVVIKRPSTADVIAANSAFVNAIKERKVSHYGQPALDESATKSTKRQIGKHGGFGFASTDEADATLVEACALAYRGAMTTKRKPGRKAVVF